MSQHQNSKQAIRLPIYIAIAIVIGILIGAQMASPKGGTSASGFAKIKQILTYIENDYVDEVNTQELVDQTIANMLEELDPHTSYITAEDNEIMRTQLQGNFEGIGIEFNIFKDTIYVIAPISGGPSIAAGLLSGDKIIR
ncbi:MAG: peptidase S41, partial [Bacteroidota bacterium]